MDVSTTCHVILKLTFPLFPDRWPANNERVISVANVAKKDNLPTAKKSNSNVQIDYAGIGVKVNSFKPDGTFTELSGTSMASPHVCGLIAALMTKGGTYEDRTTNDTAVRALLNEKFAIDIGMKGVDNATGLGFLTYLSKEEFEDDFVELPDFEEE